MAKIKKNGFELLLKLVFKVKIKSKIVTLKVTLRISKLEILNKNALG